MLLNTNVHFMQKFMNFSKRKKIIIIGNYWVLKFYFGTSQLPTCAAFGYAKICFSSVVCTANIVFRMQTVTALIFHFACIKQYMGMAQQGNLRTVILVSQKTCNSATRAVSLHAVWAQGIVDCVCFSFFLVDNFFAARQCHIL